MKRHNARFLFHIVVMMLIIGIAVGATFSWYPRSAATEYQDQGNILKYSQSGNINGEGATIKTYVGTMGADGVITYSDSSNNSPEFAAEPDKEFYFKTVITDQSTSAGDARVSLYLEKLTYTQNMKDYIHVGVINPEKTYRKLDVVNTGNTIACLEDNLILPNGSDKEVVWFVKVDSSFSGNNASFILGTLHLVYN